MFEGWNSGHCMYMHLPTSLTLRLPLQFVLNCRRTFQTIYVHYLPCYDVHVLPACIYVTPYQTFHNISNSLQWFTWMFSSLYLRTSCDVISSRVSHECSFRNRCCTSITDLYVTNCLFTHDVLHGLAQHASQWYFCSSSCLFPFRLHRMHCVDAAYCDRRRSVSVCWSRSWVLQKRLNRSRCRFGGLTHACGSKNPCNRWGDEVEIPQGNGWFLGGPAHSRAL